MAGLGGLGVLAGLGALPGGFMEGMDFRRRQMQAQMQQQIQMQALQEAQRQRQGAGIAYESALNLPPQQQQQVQPMRPAAPPQVSGTMPQVDLSGLQREVLKLESGNRDYPPDSKMGAVGPGQIMPRTAAGYGVGGNALRDPTQNRQLSGQIVGDLYKRTHGDPLATLAGYNAGPKRADEFIAAGRNPAVLPRETQNYLQKASADLGLPIEQTAQAAQTAQRTQWAIPPAMAGQMDISAMAKVIEARSPPGTPPDVKAGALLMLQKFIQPQQAQAFQQQWEAFKFGVGEQDKEATRTETSRRDTETARHNRAMETGVSRQGYQILTDPTTGQQYQMIPGRPDSAMSMSGEPYKPGGAAKVGTTKEPGVEFTPSEKQFWGNILRVGGHLPPGLTRTAAGSRLVQELMKEIPGQAGGDAGAFITNAETVKADANSLRNMTKMADAATSFERTASMNFDTALKLAKDAVPTDWGPWLNRWVMTGETQFGDVNVPPYVTAMLTGANEYAKIMSGSTGAQGSTVDSRREAAELFSPYLSQGQIARVVAIAKTDMGNRKQSLYGQIDDIKGRLHSAGSGEPTATQGQKSETAAPAGGERIIEKGGKRWRVIGGDPNDPEVEEVK
jgi:hypothetical protein